VFTDYPSYPQKDEMSSKKQILKHQNFDEILINFDEFLTNFRLFQIFKKPEKT